MLMITCLGCGASAYAECRCEDATAGGHRRECTFGDLDGQVKCSCCPEDHDHAANANLCPGGHGDCLTPDNCPVHGLNGGPCPGGHCGKDVPGCTSCRPVIVTVLPDSRQISLLERT